MERLIRRLSRSKEAILSSSNMTTLESVNLCKNESQEANKCRLHPPSSLVYQVCQSKNGIKQECFSFSIPNNEVGDVHIQSSAGYAATLRGGRKQRRKDEEKSK